MGKHYRHFKDSDRVQLATLRDAGHSVMDIAKRLNKSKSSIYREISRNSYWSKYSAKHAGQLYLKRRAKKRLIEKNIDIQEKVLKLLYKHYSPYQISVTLDKEYQIDISHESIYQFIYSEPGRKAGLSQWLPRRHKKRKNRARHKEKKIAIPNRNPIKNRPKEIDEHTIFGHWEGDLMIFSNTKVTLITLREMLSRVIIVIKNLSKKSNATAQNIISVFRGRLKMLIQSLTLDNGGEFAAHEKISKKLQLETYFCDPYASWQKGSVENGNGIIRIEMPRSIDIENMTQKAINAKIKNINNRPMRLHGNHSPAEIFKNRAGIDLTGIVALQV